MRNQSAFLAIFAGVLVSASAGVNAQTTPCALCIPVDSQAVGDRSPSAPLRIDVETALDFSRVALLSTAGGEVDVDPQGVTRRVSGALVDMGGMTLRGTARVSGQPNALIRVDLPSRVQLRSSVGAIAEVVGIKTDLTPAPRLDANGQISFSFGGRLIVKGQISGPLRGSIPITVDYQ